MLPIHCRPLFLVIISVAAVFTIIPATAGPNLGNLVPRNFEVNAMAVSPKGDVATGSFYAMDTSVIPWDLTNPIYKYASVTLIVTNINTTALASSIGINVPTATNTLIPYRIFLIIQGVQRNNGAIASDIETVFGMPANSFTTLTTSPFTLPLTIYAAPFTTTPYSNFVNIFVQKTSIKPLVIGKYSAQLLETTSSAIIFNSVESLTYPLGPTLNTGSLYSALFGTAFYTALGLNSTGAVILQKNKLDFSQAADHTLSFSSTLGLTSLKSTTNETIAAILPDGAQVVNYSPSNVNIQSSTGSTELVEALPWVGTAQRTLPDVTVTFHYPAFNQPIITPSWTTSPATFNPGQNYTLTLNLANTGAMNAKNLHVTLSYSSVVSWNQTNTNYGNGGTFTYDIATLNMGATNTRNYSFLALSPLSSFTISASFLDTQNYAYTWNSQFSVAATVNTSGPLTVTKTVTPMNPSYGQTGYINVTVSNPSSQAYYNVIDLNPEAINYLYNGFTTTYTSYGNPYITNLQANTTLFAFSVTNNYAANVISQVYVKVGNQTNFQFVAQPNIPLQSGDQWTVSYHYPAGTVPSLYNPITLELIVSNSYPQTYYGTVYTGPLSLTEDTRASYMTLNCSPCQLQKGIQTARISGTLVNVTGGGIANAQVGLYYQNLQTAAYTILQNVTTNIQGQFSYNWTSSSQLALGRYQFSAQYTGSSQFNARLIHVDMVVIAPTYIGPGGSIAFAYPYYFNTTGSVTLGPERIAYSSRWNATGTQQSLIGEYVAVSSPVTVTVSQPTIYPVVTMSLNTTKLSYLYVAQNQSYIQVNLQVTNTGQQAASSVNVTAFIPRFTGYPNITRWLPVTNTGTVTLDTLRGTVTFSTGTLQPLASATAWYIVKANSTNLYISSSNVTALDPSLSRFRFSYSGALLGVYPAPNAPQTTPPGLLQAYTTLNPSSITNGTSTTVAVILYNAGNATYTNVNVTMNNFNPSLTFNRSFQVLPSIAPGMSQAVTFTATDHTNFQYSYNKWTSQSISGTVYYNQSSTSRPSTGFYTNLVVYDSRTPGLNPSVRFDVSAPTPVSAGAIANAMVTVSNIGTSNVTNLNFNIQSYSPLSSSSGTSSPETSYGSFYNNWPGTIGPGQTVKFRIGILPRSGGNYPVFLSYANYQFSIGTNQTGYGNASASSAALITATDTTGPEITIPWASPFAPASGQPEHIWTQVSDGSGIGTVNLEYSTDKSTWISVAMIPLIGSYASGPGLVQIQSMLGDIYNATLPTQSSGTTVYYRIKATDRLGNPTLQDNNGLDFSYTVQGGSNTALITPPTGTNVQVNVTNSAPAIKAFITLNISTPISIQVTQLTSNPGGSPPTGTSALGIYLQINANESITLDARIRIYYTASQIQGLNASTITPYYWDGTSWVALENVSRNTSQNWVEGTVHHFSLFGLFAGAASNPPAPQPTPSQFPWVIVGVIVAVAVVAVIGAVFMLRRRRVQSSPMPTQGPTSPNP